MNLLLGIRSARIFGGNTSYSLAGEFLLSGLSDYVKAMAYIEITACFHSGEVGQASFQKRYDAFHSCYLRSLPRATFLRKKSRFNLAYETKVADATFLEKYGFLSVEVFSAVVNEVADRLHLMDSRVRDSDDFDLLRFHADIARKVATVPQSLEDLRTLEARLDAEKQQRIGKMGPWERLEIDWDDYHPTARKLLDDPFFWSSINDYSPHGNDMGSDVLAEYRKWNKSHPDQPSHRMATALLRAWDIAQFDLNITNPSEVSLLLDQDCTSLVLRQSSIDG